jgi:hypothetical protein
MEAIEAVREAHDLIWGFINEARARGLTIAPDIVIAGGRLERALSRMGPAKPAGAASINRAFAEHAAPVGSN